MQYHLLHITNSAKINSMKIRHHYVKSNTSEYGTMKSALIIALKRCVDVVTGAENTKYYCSQHDVAQ